MEMKGAESSLLITEEPRVGGDESISRLVAWAASQGAKTAVCTSIKLDTNIGAFFNSSSEEVKAGEEIFVIPPTVYLHASSEGEHFEDLRAQCKRDENLADKYGRLSERDKLSLRLVLEVVDKRSHWSAYVNALPKEDPCLSSWDMESLKYLEHTPIWKSTKGFQINKDILGDPSAQLLECVELLRPASVPASVTRWCHQMVMSRAFGIKFEEEGETLPTLVPVVDLLDHSNEAKVSWSMKRHEQHGGNGAASETHHSRSEIFGASKHFHFKLDGPLQGRSQLFTNYGKKGNEELLRGYGFTLMDNVYDFYIIELGIGGLSGSDEQDDPTAGTTRVALLHKMKCKKTHALSFRDPLPTELLAAATVCILPQQDVYYFYAQQASGNTIDQWLEAEVNYIHVLKALKMLHTQISSALNKMCQVATIEQDESNLFSYKSYSCENKFRKLMAIQYRLGLKRILRESKRKIMELVSKLVGKNMTLSSSLANSIFRMDGDKVEEVHTMLESYPGHYKCISTRWRSPITSARGSGILILRQANDKTKLAQISDCILSSHMASEEDRTRVKEGLDLLEREERGEFLQFVSSEDLELMLVIQEHRDRPPFDAYLNELHCSLEGRYRNCKRLVCHERSVSPVPNEEGARALQIDVDYQTWAYVRSLFIRIMRRGNAAGNQDRERDTAEPRKKRQHLLEPDLNALWTTLTIALDFGKDVRDASGKKRRVLAPVLDCIPTDALGIILDLKTNEDGSKVSVLPMCDIPPNVYLGFLSSPVGNGDLVHLGNFSNSEIIDRYGIDCLASVQNEYESLELDLGSLSSDPINAYKIRLMVALNLQRVHYFGWRKGSITVGSVQYLCMCISLICMKVEKLVKLGSDVLLDKFNDYNSNQYRLKDKMHHYQTPLPSAEKQIHESEEALEERRALFLKKLRRSAGHPQIVKKAFVLLKRKDNSLHTADWSAVQVQTLRGLGEEVKGKLKCIKN